MIVSASRRTDLPAFHGTWFSERLDAGFVDVTNPYNRHQVRRVSLRPEDVDLFVFWTRNPRPFVAELDELDRLGHRYYFLFTLTAYREELEPAAGSEEARLGRFLWLARRLGPERVIWRYDPIILSSLTPADHHRRAFARLAGALAGHTRRVIVSLAQYYRKTDRRLRALEQQGVAFERDAATSPQAAVLLADLADLARRRGMEMRTCASEVDFSAAGAPPGACIDADWIAERFGLRPDARKDPGQRPLCRCIPSRDIGTNDTCAHGCLYCYANR